MTRFLTKVHRDGSSRRFVTKVRPDGSSRRFVTAVLVLGAIAASYSTGAIASAFAREPQARATGRQAVAPAKPLGIGRVATADEIKKIDIDVMPDGRGLPEGKGTPAEGAKVYAAKCASCHGANGQGGSADRLVDRESGKNWDFAINPKLVKTVGNYWPYATTLYDYTYRAMPFMQPGTLTPDETYALVAHILALNKIIPDGAVMDRTTLPKVAMPSRDRFVIDNRKGGKVVK